MSTKAAPAPLSVQGVWQRWRDGCSTNEIARRTKHPEHEIDALISRCLDARAARKPMPWVADP